MQESPKRILIFIVAYNAERTIENVISRIPSSLSDYDAEILIIDDSSQDQTFGKAHDFQKNGYIIWCIRHFK